jgi:hypothetical protein
MRFRFDGFASAGSLESARLQDSIVMAQAASSVPPCAATIGKATTHKQRCTGATKAKTKTMRPALCSEHWSSFGESEIDFNLLFREHDRPRWPAG